MFSKPLSRRLALGMGASGLCSWAATPSFAQAAPDKPYGWKSVPYGAGGFVDGFLYHPREKGLLYARTDIGGMYRYDYAARRWIALLDHLSHDEGDLMGVLSMAIDPTDPNKLYAACGLYLPDWARAGAIFSSNDRGMTWRKTELTIHVGGNADGRGAGDRLMVDPHNPATVYYASNQDGLWRSGDGGKTFAKAPGSPAKTLNLAVFEPKTGDLYVGSAEGKGGLFVSHDKGGSFQPVAGPPAQPPQHAAFAPDGSLYVTFAQSDDGFAANPSHAVRGGVWKRDGASGDWRDISPIGPNDSPRGGYSGVDVGPDGMVAVSTIERWTPGDDIFVSKDGGAHWIALGNTSRHDASTWPWMVEVSKGEEHMGSWMSDLRINPFNADEMIYGTGGGLWMSRNLTAAGSGQPVLFDANIDNLEEGAVIQLVSPTGGATLLAAMGDTGGAAWDDITKPPKAGLFRPNTETNWSVDYAGLKPGFIVRTVSNTPAHGLYSEDVGATWNPFPASPYKPPVKGEAWRGPGQIAVSAKATHLLWVPEKQPAYFSADKGKSWTASAGWPASSDQALTPLADKAVNGVFYVFDRGGARVLISVDGGATFTPIATGLPALQGWQQAQMAVVPTRMRDLWLALPMGLIHSPDAQSPFASVKGVDAAWAVGFGAPQVKDGYPAVYLSGNVKGREGLWRSDDAGKSWVRINDDAHQFGAMHALTGDPLAYGVVYIAPHGRGVLVGRP
jgi:hypothetical protein